MYLSPFFRQLRSAYQAELDDLTHDSDGRDVLKKRLAEKRKELSFLTQMMELSPEMVAVVLHQGFKFKHPGVMTQVLGHESEELPDWDSLQDAIALEPWAAKLADTFLKEPRGDWFLVVAAGLEYMHSHPHLRLSGGDEHDDEDHHSHTDRDRDDAHPDDDDGHDDQRGLDEAGAEWLSEQGFDSKHD